MVERNSGSGWIHPWRLVMFAAALALVASGVAALSPLSAPVAGAAPAPLAITTTSPLPEGFVGSSYSETLQATGGTAPYGWQWFGAVPPGLTLSPSGTISGSPTQWGQYQIEFFVSDSSSPQEQQNAYLDLTVQQLTSPRLAITTTSVPNGTAGTPYSTTLQASGGVTPYSWSVTSGSLPSGLTLAPSGTISGTPQLPQSSTFVVQVVDSGVNDPVDPVNGPQQQQVSEQLTLAVTSGAPGLDSVLGPLGNAIASGAASLTGALGTLSGSLATLQTALVDLGPNLSCLILGVAQIVEHGPPGMC